MTIALQASLKKQGNSAGSGTSSQIDTTANGINFIFVVVADNSASPATLADSPGNSYTDITANDLPAADSSRLRTFYCESPMTSATHTWSANGTGSFGALAVACYSGVASSSLDQTSSNDQVASATTCQAGSITPGANNELVIFAIGGDCPPGSGTLTVNQSFTVEQYALLSGGNSYAIGFADIIQTTAGAVNPTFTFNAGAPALCSIQSFKQSAGGGGAAGPVAEQYYSMLTQKGH